MFERYLFLDLEVLEDYFSLTYSKYNEEPVTLVNPSRLEVANLITGKTLVGYNIKNYDLYIIYYYLNSKHIDLENLRVLSDFLINKETKSFFSEREYKTSFEKRIEKVTEHKELLENLIYPNTLKELHSYANLNTIDFSVVDLINPAKLLSIKKLDMYMNGTVNKFDFGKYTNIESIKKDNLYDVFKEYELNDVRLLSQVFREIEYKTFGVSFKELLELMLEITNFYNVDIDRYFYANPVNRTIRQLFFEKGATIDANKIAKYIKDTEQSLDDHENILVSQMQVEKQARQKGGINYVKSGIYHGNIIDVDCTSMYPNILLKPEITELLVGFKYGLYREFIETRVELKKKDSKFQLAYKILLNSTFGYLDQIYKDTGFYKATNIVTITGRKVILDIFTEISKKYNVEVLNVATDGILAIYPEGILGNEVESYINSLDLGLKVEYESYSEAFMDKANNYFLKGAKLKGRGLYSIKDGLNRILPISSHPYLTNSILDTMFNVELPKVEYILEKNGIINTGYIYNSEQDKINAGSYTFEETDIDNSSYVYTAHFQEQLELPSYLEVFRPYIKQFITTHGEKGKIMFSKGTEDKGLKAFTRYLEDGAISLAIKPNKKLLIIDIDEPVSNIYKDTYTFVNPDNNHLKKVYSLDKETPDDIVTLKNKIKQDYHLETIDNIEILFKTKHVTLFRENELYFNTDVILPLNSITETVENNTTETEEYKPNATVLKYIISLRPEYIHYSGNYFNCPVCNSQGKIQVFKNTNNLYIAKCLRSSCPHEAETIIIENDIEVTNEVSEALRKK